MATVIDAFLVTLGLDPKDFETAVKQVMADLKKLQEESDKTAEHMKEKGEKAAEFYKEILAKAAELFTFLAGAEGLKGFIKEQQELELSSGRLAKNLRISIEELSAWQNAAIMTEGSAQGLNSSMKALGGSLVDIEKNLPRAQRSLKVLQAAGVKGLSLGKKSDVLEVMDQLAEKFSKMQGFEAGRLGSRLGLDETTIRMLKLGKEGLAELKAEAGELGQITAENVKQSDELNEAEDRLTVSRTQMGRTIMHLLLPAMTMLADIMGRLAKWANEHAEIVRVAFIGIATAIAVIGINAAWALIPTIALASPVYLIAGALALVGMAIGYVYEEWKKWTKDGSSWLGGLFALIKQVWAFFTSDQMLNHLYQSWLSIKDALDVVIEAIKFVWAVLTGDGEAAIAAWNKMSDGLLTIVDRMMKTMYVQVLEGMFALLKMWDAEWERLKNSPTEAMNDLMKNPVFRFLMAGGNPVLMGVQGGADIIKERVMGNDSGDAVPRSSISNANNQRINHRTVTVGEVKIEVPAGTNPEEMGQVIAQDSFWSMAVAVDGA